MPVFAAIEQGIPVIAVHDRQCRMRNDFSALPFAPGKPRFARNYLEAAGIAIALKAGVSADTVTRPMADTCVVKTNVRRRGPNLEGVTACF